MNVNNVLYQLDVEQVWQSFVSWVICLKAVVFYSSLLKMEDNCFNPPLTEKV